MTARFALYGTDALSFVLLIFVGQETTSSR